MSDGHARTLTANGREIPLGERCSLETWLEAQGLPPRSVVVERNGEAIPPSQFSRTTLEAGDRLEIVRVVAGG